jgi:hypothetical protein
LSKIAGGKFDLYLLDNWLPGDSGLEQCKNSGARFFIADHFLLRRGLELRQKGGARSGRASLPGKAE